MLRRLALAILFLGAGTFAFAGANSVFLGVDANYSLGMEKEGKSWKWSGQPKDLFQGIADSGVQGLRVRLWTGDDGVNGKAYATEVVRRATKAGLEPYLVIFLSEDWADMVKQPLPAIWKGRDLEKRAEAVKAYSHDVVAHFRREGLRSNLYEIGNEIDYGICGVYPGKSTKKSPESLSKSCWPDAAKLILASQQGVKEADPEARFLLHIAHWWDPEFCIAFFRFMLEQGVQIDFAGLSYFPSSNIGGSLEFAQIGETIGLLHGAIKRPIIIPETAYPSTREFSGQFSRWKKEVAGYPLSPDGQRRWLSDFLDFCAARPEVASVYYWSPEWCGEGMWKGFALFDVEGNARPAWQSFKRSRAERSPPKQFVYFEFRDGRLHAVPLEEARKQAADILAKKLARFGAVNVDYIKDITTTDLVVDGYRVVLRASLSGNIDLALADPAAADDALELFKNLRPDQRAVIFATDEADPSLKPLLDLAKEKGVEAVVCPRAADLPLKFGLSAAAQTTEEAPAP